MLAIPGPLQIGDYIRGQFQRSIQRGIFTSGQVHTRVSLRLARREAALRRTDPIDINALIAEAVLHTNVGGPHTMIDQLKDLLAVARDHANVTIRIVPTGAGWHEGFAGNLVLYRYDNGLPPILYKESQHNGEFLVRRRDVRPYEQDLDWILEEALTTEDSLRLIEEVLRARQQSLVTA
jgi:hypothetical protein